MEAFVNKQTGMRMLKDLKTRYPAQFADTDAELKMLARIKGALIRNYNNNHKYMNAQDMYSQARTELVMEIENRMQQGVVKMSERPIAVPRHPERQASYEPVPPPTEIKYDVSIRENFNQQNSSGKLRGDTDAMLKQLMESRDRQVPTARPPEVDFSLDGGGNAKKQAERQAERPAQQDAGGPDAFPVADKDDAYANPMDSYDMVDTKKPTIDTSISPEEQLKRLQEERKALLPPSGPPMAGNGTMPNRAAEGGAIPQLPSMSAEELRAPDRTGQPPPQLPPSLQPQNTRQQQPAAAGAQGPTERLANMAHRPRAAQAPTAPPQRLTGPGSALFNEISEIRAVLQRQEAIRQELVELQHVNEQLMQNSDAQTRRISELQRLLDEHSSLDQRKAEIDELAAKTADELDKLYEESQELEDAKAALVAKEEEVRKLIEANRRYMSKQKLNVFVSDAHTILDERVVNVTGVEVIGLDMPERIRNINGYNNHVSYIMDDQMRDVELPVGVYDEDQLAAAMHAALGEEWRFEFDAVTSRTTVTAPSAFTIMFGENSVWHTLGFDISQPIAGRTSYTSTKPHGMRTDRTMFMHIKQLGEKPACRFMVGARFVSQKLALPAVLEELEALTVEFRNGKGQVVEFDESWTAQILVHHL